MRLLRLLSSFAFALVALTGCAAGGPIQSQVLDAQTGHPIARAMLLGVWTQTVGFGLTHTDQNAEMAPHVVTESIIPGELRITGLSTSEAL